MTAFYIPCWSEEGQPPDICPVLRPLLRRARTAGSPPELIRVVTARSVRIQLGKRHRHLSGRGVHSQPATSRSALSDKKLNFFGPAGLQTPTLRREDPRFETFQ